LLEHLPKGTVQRAPGRAQPCINDEHAEQPLDRQLMFEGQAPAESEAEDAAQQNGDAIDERSSSDHEAGSKVGPQSSRHNSRTRPRDHGPRAAGLWTRINETIAVKNLRCNGVQAAATFS